MNFTRRKFTQSGLLASVAALLGSSGMPTFAAEPLTAQQIVDKLIVAMGPAWHPTSYRDTFKMGDPDTPVKGVACCFMSTFDVIKRAHAKGLNFVISHEPTMWTDPDLLAPVQNDPLFKLKLEFVNDNKMVIWRTHDSLHSMQPEPMITAENRALRWTAYAVPGHPMTYNFAPHMSLKEVVGQFVENAPTRSARVIGDPEMTVATLAFCGHNLNPNVEGLEKYDATLSIEVREWETTEYGRDLVASGAKKAMIIVSHESGEENMMHDFPHFFSKVVPEVPIEFVITEDRMWTL